MEAWPTWKMTLNMPKLGLTSFLSLSRTQKTVGPKILEIWDTLVSNLTFEIMAIQGLRGGENGLLGYIRRTTTLLRLEGNKRSFKA